MKTSRGMRDMGGIRHSAGQAFVAWLHDCLRRALPGRTRQHGLAFLCHPRDVHDIVRMYPFLAGLSADTIHAFFGRMWPLTLSRVSGFCDPHTGREIPGWIIAVPMHAAQLLTARQTGRKRIAQALTLAEKHGAALAGLGALLPALTRHGKGLVGQTHVGLTTGHALTTWSLRETIVSLCTIAQLPLPDAVIAIVGAGGSIGRGVAYALAEQRIGTLILIDRAQRELHSFGRSLEQLSPGIQVAISPDKAAIRDADIIVTATNAPDAVLRSADVSPGSIVLNDAQPSDLAPDVHDRTDVLALEGGLVTIPGISTQGVLGLLREEDVFGCLGETMVLAAHGWQDDYALGRLDPRLIAHIGRLARAVGVTAAPLQTARRLVTAEDIHRLRALRPHPHPRKTAPCASPIRAAGA